MDSCLLLSASCLKVTFMAVSVLPSHGGFGDLRRSAQITSENRPENDKGEPPHPPPREGVEGVVTRRALPEQVSLVNVLVYNHSQHSLWRSPIRQMSTRHQTRA